MPWYPIYKVTPLYHGFLSNIPTYGNITSRMQFTVVGELEKNKCLMCMMFSIEKFHAVMTFKENKQKFNVMLFLITYSLRFSVILSF